MDSTKHTLTSTPTVSSLFCNYFQLLIFKWILCTYANTTTSRVKPFLQLFSNYFIHSIRGISSYISSFSITFYFSTYSTGYSSTAGARSGLWSPPHGSGHRSSFSRSTPYDCGRRSSSLLFTFLLHLVFRCSSSTPPPPPAPPPAYCFFTRIHRHFPNYLLLYITCELLVTSK